MAGMPGLKSVECPIAFSLHESGKPNDVSALSGIAQGDKIQNKDYEVES